MPEKSPEFSIDVEVPKVLALERLKDAVRDIVEVFPADEQKGQEVLAALEKKLPEMVNRDILYTELDAMHKEAVANRGEEADLLLNLSASVYRREVLG